MHIHFLDPYIQRTSLVHSLDPRIKLVHTLAFILTVAFTPTGIWAVYILLFAILLAVEVLSDLGVGYVLKRALLAFPFVLAAFPLIFTSAGDTLVTLPLGSWALRISQPGLERFISIALKSWISVQAAIVLASTTPFPQLLVAMRAIRIPRLLVAIFGLMWRYLFVLGDEALRLIRARASRSGRLQGVNVKSGGSLIWRARVAGGMAGNLFLRALERSDRIYMAMLSRGYDGEVRSRSLPELRASHWLILILGLVILVGLMALAFMLQA
jgi:cobalt/nickel transport system permease protein